jgi:hypothetical protein
MLGDLDAEPYDLEQPVAGFDERPLQLVAETRTRLPAIPGRHRSTHGWANYWSEPSGDLETMAGLRQAAARNQDCNSAHLAEITADSSTALGARRDRRLDAETAFSQAAR